MSVREWIIDGVRFLRRQEEIGPFKFCGYFKTEIFGSKIGTDTNPLEMMKLECMEKKKSDHSLVYHLCIECLCSDPGGCPVL